jgi:hypothetical protein
VTLLRSFHPAETRLEAPVRRILNVQMPDGAIPWFEDGPWDAWNHLECVMALNIAGATGAARAGLQALAARQQSDGSFCSEYGNALPMADHVHISRVPGVQVKDTNFTAYVATAALHQAMMMGVDSIAWLWPVVQRAIEQVISCQHAAGDFAWCAEAFGGAGDDSLWAGNACIYASLGHAIRFAEYLDLPQPAWAAARLRLRLALRHAPERFDRAGKNRSGFAMDWYYPVLCGLYPAAAGRTHLQAGWARFVDAGLGCRCVCDEPWVTVAESCELAIACAMVGDVSAAAALLSWVENRRDAEGAFWMGWQNVEKIDWPAEQPTWTQAAYVLAVDAVEQVTKAARFFKL